MRRSPLRKRPSDLWNSSRVGCDFGCGCRVHAAEGIDVAQGSKTLGSWLMLASACLPMTAAMAQSADSAAQEILRQQEDWSGLSDSGQRLTLARLLPTTRMETGDYEIKIRIKDRVTGQVQEPSEKFTIIQ